jgi:hypothetical protein
VGVPDFAGESGSCRLRPGLEGDGGRCSLDHVSAGRSTVFSVEAGHAPVAVIGRGMAKARCGVDLSGDDGCVVG